MRTEHFSSGLTIVRPVNPPKHEHRRPHSAPPASGGREGRGDASMASGISEGELGLDHRLPWSETFDIQPTLVSLYKVGRGFSRQRDSQWGQQMRGGSTWALCLHVKACGVPPS